MASNTFKYKKIPGPTGSVLRPIIPVELIKKSTSIHYEVLLDTGADICLFGSEIAEILGIDPTVGEPHEITGVGGAVTVGTMHKIGITVPGFDTYTALAFFSKDLNEMHPGILGQVCFFDHFKVTFDYQKRHITIRDR